LLPYPTGESLAGLGKAFEKCHFRPTYAEANVGHPSDTRRVRVTVHFSLNLPQAFDC
jgi:hypothetical protein